MIKKRTPPPPSTRITASNTSTHHNTSGRPTHNDNGRAHPCNTTNTNIYTPVRPHNNDNENSMSEHGKVLHVDRDGRISRVTTSPKSTDYQLAETNITTTTIYTAYKIYYNDKIKRFLWRW